MDLFGDPDINYIPMRMRACLDRSFSDLAISEMDDCTLLGGTWTDEGTGQEFRLVHTLGTCIILREDDWPGDEDGYLFCQDSALTFHDVAHQVSDERVWRESFGAFLALVVSVEDVIEERAKPAISRIRAELSDEMAADDVPVIDEPDVEGAFRAFEDACRRRLPYCAGIDLSFWEDGAVHSVQFGHRPGEEDQILYRLRHDDFYGTFMYLNGLETDPDSYEGDIAEHHQDPWARVGAIGAARDLIAIRDAAGTMVRDARREVDAQLYQEELDIEVGVHLGEPDAEEALRLHRRTFEDRRKAAFEAVFARINSFLNQDEPQASTAG